MTEIDVRIKMPASLEKMARKAGLLSGKFVRGAIERELERRSASKRLIAGVARLKAAGLAPLTAAEIEAEVHAARVEREPRAPRR